MELPIDNRSVYAAVGHGGFDPSADSVVFLHGDGSDHTEWVLPTRFFDRKGRNVMALVFPGSGRSRGPTPHHIHQLAPGHLHPESQHPHALSVLEVVIIALSVLP